MRKDIMVALALASLLIITPLTGIAQENKMSNNLTEQIDINGLVVQIRTVINEVLENYGHIPIISSLCNVILNLTWFPGNILYCIFLIILRIPLLIIYFTFFIIFLFIPPKFDALIEAITDEIIRICLTSTQFFFDWWFPSFQSIYTMLETKDNTNTFDGCPCLL